MEYAVKGNGDNMIKTAKYKVNLYYNPFKRAGAICDIQDAIAEQSEVVEAMMAGK